VNQQADNDYYFAGIYTTIITNNLGTNAPYTPVGTVPVNENAAERLSLAPTMHSGTTSTFRPR
jgi:hypothetical protein